MPEDRRTVLGVVATDPLEDAGPVVEAVRQDVDLRVLPGDELPVQPDEVRLVHVRRPFSYACRWPSTAPSASAVVA